MRRPLPVRARTLTFTLTLNLTLAGASLMGVACTNETLYNPANGSSASSPAEDTVEQGLEALQNFCGNGKCDHHETCSTCAADCGTCPPPPPPVTACNSTGAPPAAYQHIVIFSFENRTWSNVGLGFSATTMPYLHSLASACTYFSDWTETNTQQNSLTQYIGETSGVDNPNTVNDCNPSTTCRSTDNNIFRQVRVAGGTARSYVEGATTGCSASGNAAKHIPALYYFGTYTDGTGTHNDHDFCNTEVRPYGEFDPNNLPTYAFITPTLCNDGHDCGDATVDAWAQANIQPVLDSAAYQAGTVAVFVWYDEDHPVPNLHIAPTSHAGDITTVGIGTHAALLKTIEDMLGLPFMNQGQLPGATDLRSVIGI